jgi:hypothetical protein
MYEEIETNKRRLDRPVADANRSAREAIAQVLDILNRVIPRKSRTPFPAQVERKVVELNAGNWYFGAQSEKNI